MDSLVLDTVVGLLFVFAVFSVFVSAVQEAVARWMGLRGEYLLRGLRTLVSGGGDFRLDLRDLLGKAREVPAATPGVQSRVTDLMQSRLVAPMSNYGNVPALAGNAPLSNAQRRRLPSYIPARTAARAILALVVPNQAGQTTMTEIVAALSTAAQNDPLKTALLDLAQEADGDITRFRKSIEDWYDDHMDRVSGWYKRHVRWITLGVAAATVLAFNLNVVAISQSLYSNQALRGSVLTAATEKADCEDLSAAGCLDRLREQIDVAGSAGLPMGWGDVPDCAGAVQCNIWERKGLLAVDGSWGDQAAKLATVLLGWLLMTAAAVPGARFWFDALSRLGSLRSTGPRPKTTAPPAEPAV